VPPSPSSVNFARVFDQIGLLYQKGSTPIATIDTLLAEAILRSLLGSDHYALFQLKNLAYLQKQTLMEPLLEVINGLSVCREIDGLVAYTGGIGGGSKRCTITVEDKTKIRQALDCTHLTYPDEQLRIVELIRRQQ
jgi:hypothetical protein